MRSIRYLSRPTILSLLMLLTAAASGNTSAETFAMIGTGSVGSSLGQRLTQLGHTVVYGSRDSSRASVQALVEQTGGGATAAIPADAVIGADVVVLAVPWNAVESVVGPGRRDARSGLYGL